MSHHTEKRIHFRVKGETEIKELHMDVSKLDVQFFQGQLVIEKMLKGKKDPYGAKRELVAAITDIAEIFVVEVETATETAVEEPQERPEATVNLIDAERDARRSRAMARTMMDYHYDDGLYDDLD